MSTRTSYEPGTPCWIDLMTPDVDESKTFYSDLFGWDARDEFDDEGSRIYTNFRHGGDQVAGMGGQPPEMEGAPPVWNTYVAVEDVDASAEAVEAAGGTVMMPPMEVMDQGRMAIFADPTGAVVSVWQPDGHTGAEVVNEPDTWAWNELLTRDVDGALEFYQQVFGWTYQAMEMPMGTYHVVAGSDEGGIAGVMAMPDGIPEQVPSHWLVYFLVADAQATVDRATELGATVAHGPEPSGVGILATLHDPLGATFAIMQPADSAAETG